MTATLEAQPQAAPGKGIKLTSLSSCAGCAAKLPQQMLAELLRQMPAGASPRDPRVLVGSDGFDDAGVYKLRPDLAMVQTVDFFTPIVDDPYDFGEIAAANAISDIYAMGGRPITALNLLGIPADKVPPAVVAKILRGGLSKAQEAACNVLGGHTIRLPEPIYGMSVSGIVHPKKILSNTRARAGDLLVLTKPLGTGIATTAIKRGMASGGLMRRVVRSMKQINTAGAELAEKSLVRAATDVTGFGLLGHLDNIVRASEVTAEIIADDVPNFGREIIALIEAGCIPGGTRTNLAAAEAVVDFNGLPESQRLILADAQTSGGLLLCVAPANLGKVCKVLSRHEAVVAAVIGRIVRGKPRIRLVGQV